MMPIAEAGLDRDVCGWLADLSKADRAAQGYPVPRPSKAAASAITATHDTLFV